MTHDYEGDGYSNPFRSARSQRNSRLKLSDGKWRDGDQGDMSEKRLISAGVDEFARTWTDNGPIDDSNTSDIDEKNAAIPVAEWPKGLDGKPRPPWELYHAAYLIDFVTGQKYVYASTAKGADVAINELKSCVETRGSRVVPVIRLSTKPWSPQYGMRTRPHFEITGEWKISGEELLLSAPAPQLEAPSKSSADLAAETLAAMDDAREPTLEEIIDDEIKF